MAYDCIVVGGGPAGLATSIYLSRFRRRHLVIDAGQSRAMSIPMSHNQPSYPEGISGPDLLARMRTHALAYDPDVASGMVTRVERCDPGFRVVYGEQSALSKTVLVATGVVDRRPRMTVEGHSRGLALGLIRYCPICDGYEARGREIAVLGGNGRGVDEAVFLRNYSDRVTLVTQQEMRLTEESRARIQHAGIRVEPTIVSSLEIEDGKIVLEFGGGQFRRGFDTLYPSLGSDVQTGFLGEVGVKCSGQGCIVTDAHQRTCVEGLFAAGDVVLALDQISVACGEAAIAATTIHRQLCGQLGT